MRVVLADSYGMCFGVRDALALALEAEHPGDLTVLGELAHNPEVVNAVSAQGIRAAPGIDAPIATRRVMITAHGASDAARARLAGRGLEVVDATCPLVRHAHRTLLRLAEEGYFPVVIGDPDHVEVRGLVEDLGEHTVIRCEDDLPELAGRSRIGVVSQTTQPLDRVLELVDRIRATYPEADVRFRDTVCQPTKDRQDAARRLAAECDTVVVVGGRGSNNTRQLAARCAACGARVHPVEGAHELDPAWFREARTVGLTAGTSTPDRAVREVYRWLLRLADERTA